jgi:thiol:disulfide interchange protein
MRKLLIALALFFTLIGIVFTVLPMGTMAVLPMGIALVFAVLAFLKSDEDQKSVSKYLLFFTVIVLVFIVGKVVFIQDEVAEDAQFEETKIDSVNEAIEELDELDELDGLDELDELDGLDEL